MGVARDNQLPSQLSLLAGALLFAGHTEGMLNNKQFQSHLDAISIATCPINTKCSWDKAVRCAWPGASGEAIMVGNRGPIVEGY